MVVIAFLCQWILLPSPAVAAFGVYPAIVEDKHALVGQEYVLTLVNDAVESVQAELELGMASIDIYGTMSLCWSDDSRMEAETYIHLLQPVIDVPGDGSGAATLRIAKLPEQLFTFPVVAVRIAVGAMRPRWIVPLLLQDSTKQSDLILESVEWRDTDVVITVGNQGCGFAKAEAALRILTGDGTWVPGTEVQGYVFPQQTRQWVLALPDEHIAAELSTSLDYQTWLSSSRLP